MKIFNKKGDMDLTIKILFAVFIVIFILFIMFYVLKSRTDTVEQKQTFDYYYLANNFLLSLL
jgi:uncharacterized protein (UPF0333 family)